MLTTKTLFHSGIHSGNMLLSCSFQSQVVSHNSPFSVSVHGSTTFQPKWSYISHRRTSDMNISALKLC